MAGRPTRRRVAGSLFAGVAIAVAGAGLARSGLADPDPTLLLVDRRGGFLGEVPGPDPSRAGFWRIPDVPPRVAAATIAVEDRRFALHPGVDPLAVARAALNALAGRAPRSGASTLAMQVARLQEPGPRTLARKAREAAAALALTARHGRAGVLRQYLRLAPYGNRIHGVAYAARRYFDKPAADLSWAEAAFLAAVPQSPARMNPAVPAGRARAAARGRRILDRLLAAGEIRAAEHALAAREIAALGLPAAPLPHRPPEALHAVLRLARDLGGGGAARRADPLVRTTIDPRVQEEAVAALADALPRLRADGAGNAAAVVVDARDATVLAWAGSAGYFDPVGSGAIDYAALPRPAGSTLKPFLFALALDRGAITPATPLEDARRGPGGVENADQDSLGTTLPRFALANSRNVPAVRLFERLGPGEAWGLLADLGLAAGPPPRAWGAGLALGAFPVSLEALVRAYAVFPADGRLRPLRWTRDAPPAPPRRAVSEEAARAVTLFLADPLARLPGFPRRGPTEHPYAVAAKTGTSSGSRDAWTVAWSRRAVVGVWVGRADFRPMRGASGYGAAAAVAGRILDALHGDELDGMADVPFPPPRGYRPARLCARSGGVPGPACDRVAAEWLPPAAPAPPPCTACSPAAAAPARRPPEGAVAPRLRVRAPEEGTTLLLDPETPRGAATIALEAEVEPPDAEVVWYVDGAPWRTVGRPFSARWPLASGSHFFEVRFADRAGSSPPVRVLVR